MYRSLLIENDPSHMHILYVMFSTSKSISGNSDFKREIIQELKYLVYIFTTFIKNYLHYISTPVKRI